jgi:hypothetical protein
MSATTRTTVRRNSGQQRALLERFDLSRLSAQDFCRKEGLSLSSFRRWQHRQAVNASAPGFVELQAPAASAPGDDGPWAIELDLPGGVRLRLRGGR